ASSSENEPNDLLLEIDHQIVDLDDDNNEKLHEGTLQLYIEMNFTQTIQVCVGVVTNAHIHHVNFNNRKRAKEIICTSLVDKDNHEMNPFVAQTALHFRKLPEEVIEDIKFYTCSIGGLGATLQYNLLKAKYPNKYIDKKDMLLALKTKDSNWIVVPKIEGKRNRLIALFWISLLQVSLWTQFYNIVLTNNTCKTNCYEMVLEELISATNEGINAIIKKEVSRNTTLLYLVDAMQNRLNEEARYAWINEQKKYKPYYRLASHCKSIFSNYRFFDPEDKDFSEPENIIEDGYIEDDYERCQMGLRSLLQTLNYGDILQIWAIMPQGSFPNYFSNHVLHTRNVLTPTLKKSISKKSHWSKGYGISKKVLNLMICFNCNNEFFQIMEGFISSKIHELELLKNEKENNENVIELQQSVVANLYVTKYHGRSSKHFKDALENTTNTCQNSQNTKSIVNHIEQHEKKEKKVLIVRILVIILEPVQYN
ncbi:27607_t:CDS:2, partial [Gigaspora margarita]